MTSNLQHTDAEKKQDLKIIMVTEENFDLLKPEDLNNENLYGKIKDYVIHDIYDSRDVFRAKKCFGKLIELLSKNGNLNLSNSRLFEGYLELLIALKMAALPILEDAEVHNLFVEDLFKLLRTTEIQIREAIHAYIIWNGEEQKSKKIILTAIENNRGTLGSKPIQILGDTSPSSPTIRSWISDYNRSVGKMSEKRGSLEHLSYVNQNSNAKLLNSDEKKLLLQILEVYDWLRNTESIMPVISEPAIKATTPSRPVPSPEAVGPPPASPPHGLSPEELIREIKPQTAPAKSAPQVTVAPFKPSPEYIRKVLPQPPLPPAPPQPKQTPPVQPRPQPVQLSKPAPQVTVAPFKPSPEHIRKVLPQPPRPHYTPPVIPKPIVPPLHVQAKPVAPVSKPLSTPTPAGAGAGLSEKIYRSAVDNLNKIRQEERKLPPISTAPLKPIVPPAKPVPPPPIRPPQPIQSKPVAASQPPPKTAPPSSFYEPFSVNDALARAGLKENIPAGKSDGQVVRGDAGAEKRLHDAQEQEDKNNRV